MSDAVSHIFVPDAGSWRWVATVRGTVSEVDAKRGLRAMGLVRLDQRIRMVPVTDSPVLVASADGSGPVDL
jgi:hypothetical protein